MPKNKPVQAAGNYAGLNVPFKRSIMPKYTTFIKVHQMRIWNRLNTVQQIRKQINTLNSTANISKMRL